MLSQKMYFILVGNIGLKLAKDTRSGPVLRSRSVFDWLRLRVFFSPAPAPIKLGFQPLQIF